MRNEAMLTKRLSADISLSLAEKVEELADRLDRSPAWIVEQALSAWIVRDDEQRRLTLEALSDVDAGATVDHHAVRAWADSLSTDEPLAVPDRWT